MDSKAPRQDPASSHVRQALAAQRIEDLTREITELKATRSELQYDLSVSVDALAEERKKTAVVKRDNQALQEKVQHVTELLSAQEKAVELLAEARYQTAMAKHDREELRELAAVREQLGEAHGKLAVVVHQRKSLRGELRRRGQLLARARSELRSAQEAIGELRRHVRGLERDRWTLEMQMAENKGLRHRQAQLEKLVEQLSDGFHAVLASHRWRLGGALLFLPRLLVRRPGKAAEGERGRTTVPDYMLALVSAHRTRGTLDRAQDAD